MISIVLSLVLKLFLGHSSLLKSRAAKSVLDRTWAILGANRSQNCIQKGAQKEIAGKTLRTNKKTKQIQKKRPERFPYHTCFGEGQGRGFAFNNDFAREVEMKREEAQSESEHRKRSRTSKIEAGTRKIGKQLVNASRCKRQKS